MNIALIGYGRMGHEIETMTLKRGHSIKLIIDINNQGDLNASALSGIDAAIEFSSPEAAYENIMKCLSFGVPVVSGTTGWLENYAKVVDRCMENNTSFIHSSNFSIGVNILFRLNKELARYISVYDEYAVSIEEIHHTKKLDSPSGTAITLANGIIESHPAYSKWNSQGEGDREKDSIPVKAIREGLVPGTHTVQWDSEIDTISLKHEARSRKGFALGAVIAAEYIHNRKGVFTMSDVMGF